MGEDELSLHRSSDCLSGSSVASSRLQQNATSLRLRSSMRHSHSQLFISFYQIAENLTELRRTADQTLRDIQVGRTSMSGMIMQMNQWMVNTLSYLENISGRVANIELRLMVDNAEPRKFLRQNSNATSAWLLSLDAQYLYRQIYSWYYRYCNSAGMRANPAEWRYYMAQVIEAMRDEARDKGTGSDEDQKHQQCLRDHIAVENACTQQMPMNPSRGLVGNETMDQLAAQASDEFNQMIPPAGR